MVPQLQLAEALYQPPSAVADALSTSVSAGVKGHRGGCVSTTTQTSWMTPLRAGRSVTG